MRARGSASRARPPAPLQLPPRPPGQPAVQISRCLWWASTGGNLGCCQPKSPDPCCFDPNVVIFPLPSADFTMSLMSIQPLYYLVQGRQSLYGLTFGRQALRELGARAGRPPAQSKLAGKARGS